MPSFDDLAREFQQAQAAAQTDQSRGAQQRLAEASRALKATNEASAQREATRRAAARVKTRSAGDWW